MDGAKLSQERKRTRRLMKDLPRGITIGERRDRRPKPFFVRHGNPRKIESFATEEDRNDKAAKLGEAVETHGKSLLNFDPAEWNEFQAWKTSRGQGMAIKDAVEKYMALRLREDLIEDSDHHLHVKLHLKRLVERFGEKRVDEVTTDELREWFPRIYSPRLGGPIGKIAQRNYRKDVNFFFARGVNEGWWMTNPCRMVKPPKARSTKRGKLEPRKIFDLLKFNRSEPVIGRIALELFGAMRSSSAGRAELEHINFQEKTLWMPGVIEDEEGEERQGHKSGKNVQREGHLDILWLWLKHAPDACWTDIGESNYDHVKSQAFLRARVKNPGNGLRHSFVSYMLAITKSYEHVGYWAQHRNRATTIGYEGTATEADAKLVMAMTPAAVSLTWEEFVARPVSPTTKGFDSP